MTPKIISDNFFQDSADVVNVPNLKAALIRKCTELMKNCNSGTTYYDFLSNIHHVRCDDINYFYFECGFNGMTTGMKRYHLGAYSFLFFYLYYYDSNVIDANKSYTLDQVKERFKNYINSLHQIVNK